MGYLDPVKKYVVVWLFHKGCNSRVRCGAEVKSKSFSFLIGIFLHCYKVHDPHV